MSDPHDRSPRGPLRVPAPSRRDVLRAALGAGAVAAATVPLGPARSAQAFANRARTPGSLAPVRYALRLARADLAPAGRRQSVTVADGTVPAPEIRFREGFLFRAEIANGLDQPTALHWHGLPVPNPMDGEIGITQLPIAPGAVAVYEFPAAEPGTYWYHSTAGFQRQLGLAGALVIEESEDSYDVQRDRVVFLSDWLVGDPDQVIPDLRARGSQPEPAKRFVNPGPDGTTFATDVRFSAFLMNGRGHRNAWTCVAETGHRVRLRLINGSAQTFFRFMIADHRLEVVAADGRPIEPVVVDDLVIGIGERYDVVVSVGAPGSYAIRAAALGQSGGAIGALHTPGAKPTVSTVPPRWGETLLRYDMLRAREPRELPAGPGRNVRVAIAEDPAAYRFTMNGQSFPADAGSGALPEPLRIQPGERVRMEIENKTRFSQAIHLHGHEFRLLTPSLDASRAPRKDTLWIEPRARARIEFAADNPGRWLLDGMGLYRRRAGLARVVAYVAGSATV